VTELRLTPLALWLVAGSLVYPVTASAEPSSAEITTPASAQLTWNEDWARFTPVEYGVVLVSAGVALGATFSEPKRNSPWTHTWDVDEKARGALRAGTRGGRLSARTASDLLLVTSLSYPTIGDSVLNAWWHRDSGDVAYQMLAIDLEVAAVTAALSSVTKTVTSRERPYGRECGGELNKGEPDCVDKDRFFSHFSGHASFSFAAASATCMHHYHLPLYGAWSPLAPCALGYAVAGVTGALRIVADRHYVTDVSVGAAVGTTVGLLIPWLHYRGGTTRPHTASWVRRHQLLLAPSGEGILASGVF
jgi:hypothetical protein